MNINKIPTYNKYLSQPATKSNGNNRDIPFNGCALKYPLAGIAIGVTMGFAAFIPVYLSGNNEKMISKHVGWDKNIRVLASNGQNVNGIVEQKNSYLASLTDELKKPNIKSVEQASGALSKNGYSVLLKKYHPLETPGSILNIFDKTLENKNRFILVCSQVGCKEDINFSKSADKFAHEMQELYNMPQENIIRISVKSKEDFKKGVDSVMSVIGRLKDKSNIELLISATGHGAATSPRIGAQHIEGAMEGLLFGGQLDETTVKQMFKENLKDIKTLFLINACQSGAWIADSGKTTAKKTLQLFA